MNPDLDKQLDQFERDGYLIIPNALNPEETERVRQKINYGREQGWQEGLNEVGNMWFDTFLEREPGTFGPLVAHKSIRPYLEALLGPQLQLRSFRAHINPGPYLQEWHMDFYGYWMQPKRRLSVRGVAVNTTFYLQDNAPGIAHLKFVKHGHLFEPHAVHPSKMRGLDCEFRQWCERQEHVVLYPKAGDCVIFFSHMPHQGAKEDDSVERSNVVCHYQSNPFYEGVWFVSRTKGEGIYPLGRPQGRDDSYA